MLIMTDDQKNHSAAAIARAVRHFHTQGALAMAIGAHQSYVSRIVTGTQLISAVCAVQIEQATKGAIRRHELRPDLWDAPKRPRSLDQDVARGGFDPRITAATAAAAEKFSVVDHVLSAPRSTPSLKPTKGESHGKARSGQQVEEAKGKGIAAKRRQVGAKPKAGGRSGERERRPAK